LSYSLIKYASSLNILGDFFVPEISGLMFRKSKPRLAWRALPLRNETPYSSSAAILLPNQIWFTPEVIVLDAVDFVIDLLWLAKIFKKALPISIFRIGALSLLLLIVIGFRQSTVLSAAIIPNQNQVLVSENQIEIKTKIKATETQFIAWPVPRTYISTFFSSYHKGIDIPSPYGRPIKPFSNGTIVYAGWQGGFGNLVQIKHRNGYLTKYAHLSNIYVKAGQRVGNSTSIGSVGATGYATGSHLHFEIYKDGLPIDPLSILP